MCDNLFLILICNLEYQNACLLSIDKRNLYCSKKLLLLISAMQKKCRCPLKCFRQLIQMSLLISNPILKIAFILFFRFRLNSYVFCPSKCGFYAVSRNKFSNLNKLWYFNLVYIWTCKPQV